MAAVERLEPRQADEVRRGERFAFGKNWAQFLALLTQQRIQDAERSLQEMLGMRDLAGLAFLDVGCGSGLFSLAAARLGARRVHSLDVDPDSVRCASELRRRYAPQAEHWTVGVGSVLDREHLSALGEWDVVYAWGVLHHTGSMYDALLNVGERVAPGGRLFVSIYNDQGGRSRVWLRVKRTYNKLPPVARAPYAVLVMLPRELWFAAVSLVRGRTTATVRGDAGVDGCSRGMSRWHDLIDWVGGYPFEVATPEAIFSFFRDRGFTLERLKTCRGGIGCNEFVFIRNADST